MRFGDAFSKYQPFSQSEELFRFVLTIDLRVMSTLSVLYFVSVLVLELYFTCMLYSES